MNPSKLKQFSKNSNFYHKQYQKFHKMNKTHIQKGKTKLIQREIQKDQKTKCEEYYFIGHNSQQKTCKFELNQDLQPTY
jgi:hypothetical protein